MSVDDSVEQPGTVSHEDDGSIAALVAHMMLHANGETQHVLEVAKALLDDAVEARRELASVRARVEKAISGPWMPTPEAIRAALYDYPLRSVGAA